MIFERAPILNPTPDGDHVLILALEREDDQTLPLLRLALENGAASLISVAGSLGLTPLTLAATLNNSAAAELLLSFGAHPNLAAKDGDDAMCRAVACNNAEMAWLLVRHGYDFHPPGKAPAATLTAAIMHNDSRAAAEFLMALGADVNAANSDGVTPLMAAAERGDGALIERLLTLGAETGSADQNGKTALMRGASALTAEAACAIVSAGADIDARNKAGETALMMALEAQNDGLSRALISAGADITRLSKENKSALSIAVDMKMTDALRDMLARKPDLTGRHHRGRSALHIACNEGCHDMALALLEAGADPNAQDDALLTPLVHALRHPEIIRSLLKYGADPTIRTKSNETVLHFARNLREPATAAIIAAHLAQKSKKDTRPAGPC